MRREVPNMKTDVWDEQCKAALRIRDDFGWWKASGYLVGEKFINGLRPENSMSEDQLLAFATKIRETIPRGELESYFKNVSRVGALGHVMDDESYRASPLDDAGPAEFAQDLLLIEKAKKLILG